MPLSEKLLARMKTWGNNSKRITIPQRETLFNRIVSVLTPAQVEKFLRENLVINENKRKAIERRAGNLRSLNGFMKNYYRRRYVNRSLKRKRNNNKK